MVMFMIGNFMLLSLFIAILLQNFEEKADEDDEEEEKNETDLSSPMKSDYLATSQIVTGPPKKPLKQKLLAFLIRINYEYVAAFGTAKAINDAEKVRQNNVEKL